MREEVYSLIQFVNILMELDLVEDGIKLSPWEIVDRCKGYSLYRLSVDAGY